MCQQGYCSNIAGRCEDEPNEVVAQSVRLYNGQWPTYCLYMSSWSNLAVTEDCNDDSSLWNLLELPASLNSHSSFERKHFMLGNVKWPSFVAETGTGQSCERCYD